MKDKFLNITDFARQAVTIRKGKPHKGVSRKAVHDWIKRGVLPHRRISGVAVIPAEYTRRIEEIREKYREKGRKMRGEINKKA